MTPGSKRPPLSLRVRVLDRFVRGQGALERAYRLAEMAEPERAFALFARAARAGRPEAQHRLGRCYLAGDGVPVSRPQGILWLNRAGAQGHADSQVLLATIYLHGLPGSAPSAEQAGNDSLSRRIFAARDAVPVDIIAALRWARTAAEGGSPEGQAVLGHILSSGPEAHRAPEEAELWYRRSAKAGCPQGALGLAIALARHAVGEAAQREVASLLRQAADAGLPAALYLLGLLHERGSGVSQDLAAATDLFRRAAEKGNRAAQARWGRALMEGQGAEANPQEALTWLRRAALAGEAEAAYLVGKFHAEGGTQPPNYTEAAVWLERAAQAGSRRAAQALGMLYLTGAGVPRDVAQATLWFRRAAGPANLETMAEPEAPGSGGTAEVAQPHQWLTLATAEGDLLAEYRRGLALAEGLGVKRDERQALILLRRAAEGVANAQHLYGMMRLKGRGGEPDPVEGRAWIAKAAVAGLPEAQVLLAELLLTGVGGPRDAREAVRISARAAAHGHVPSMYVCGMLHGGAEPELDNIPQATRWLRAAAERGHAAAQVALERLEQTGSIGACDPETMQGWFRVAARADATHPRGS
jgi:uncharacterized protein